jgi:L-malate glycosyltransferase
MKVAIIAEQFEYKMGGIARSVQRIANSLTKENVGVVVITFDYKDPEYFSSNLFKPEYNETNLKDNLKLIKIGPISKKVDILQPGFMASQKRNFFSILTKILEKERPDIIHSFYILKSGFMGVLAGKRLGIPCVVSVRGNDISRDIFDFSKFGAIKYTLDNANFITFVNDISYNDGKFLLKNDNYKIILNSCDITQKEVSLDEKNNLKDELQIPKEKFIVGYCGAVREKKGVQYLIEAFKILSKRSNDFHLLIVGDFAKENEIDSYKKIIKENDFDKKITITGKVTPEKIVNYYNLMDVCCIPSINDGLSNSLLEALSLGIPTIVSEIFSGIVEDKKNSIVFESMNSRDLADKIRLLKDDPELRERISKEAIKFSKIKFDPAREAKEYREVYFNLLK